MVKAKTAQDAEVDQAVQDIADQIHESCENLPRALYKRVLEEVSTEIEGRLEAVKEEMKADGEEV